MLNSFAGYASDFKESSFDQVEGIKQLEEDFFPHEDLVRWFAKQSLENVEIFVGGLQSREVQQNAV